jgi:hypothetical protein
MKDIVKKEYSMNTRLLHAKKKFVKMYATLLYIYHT